MPDPVVTDPPADPPPADPPAADPPAGDPPPADPPARKNSLASGADGDNPPVGDDPPIGEPGPDGRPAWCPAKFWDAETKTVRSEQLAKSYGEFEKRFRTDGAELPADPDGYKLELADGEELGLSEEATKEFATFAHTLKLDNAQFNAIIREHHRGVVDAVETVRTVEAERTQEALLKEHGDEKAVRAVQRNAYKAFEKFATPEELELVGELPDHPAIVNVLARIGAALAEDTPPGQARTAPFESLTQEVDRLYRDQAGPYFNPSHPDHFRAVEKVKQWEEQCTARGVNSLELRRSLRSA